ncbi:glycosyltransferase [Escherichia coli]|nr:MULTISPECIES: glycosyltransferase [Enterobacteriaceae]EFK1573472.1 glycosyltransferase family 1 protein [Escherichia coli]ELO4907921.1 glycosyltransferase [Escherichia coli]MBC9690596.1 glycosyltransferase [Escherichia coli]MBN6674761.1 glycosyltransferase [Escherichia coli]MBU5659334.1 glycosyltransferase [Escherichia sp. S2_ASV_4]
MKVAHILKNFEPGGVEKWLVDLTEYNNNQDIPCEFTFLLQSKKEGFFNDEIKGMSGQIVPIEYNKKNFFIYCFNLYLNFKKNKYDVIHSHVYTFSGFIVFIAFLAGIKVRIVHCHNDKIVKNESIIRKVYNKICFNLVNKFSTHKIAVSEESANYFFKNKNNLSIIPCGLSFKDYQPIEQKEYPIKKIKLLHVGSLSKQKNHVFMIKIAEELKKRNIDFIFYWIGDGPLKDNLLNDISKKGLTEQIKYLGKTKDVSDFMLNNADIFIFPSLFEGLGLAAVEAQFYGLHTLISNNLPHKLILSSYIKKISIDDNAVSEWANEISSFNYLKPNEISECKETILNSNLNIKNNYNLIRKIYSEG